MADNDAEHHAVNTGWISWMKVPIAVQTMYNDRWIANKQHRFKVWDKSKNRYLVGVTKAAAKTTSVLTEFAHHKPVGSVPHDLERLIRDDEAVEVNNQFNEFDLGAFASATDWRRFMEAGNYSSDRTENCKGTMYFIGRGLNRVAILIVFYLVRSCGSTPEAAYRAVNAGMEHTGASCDKDQKFLPAIRALGQGVVDFREASYIRREFMSVPTGHGAPTSEDIECDGETQEEPGDLAGDGVGDGVGDGGESGGASLVVLSRKGGERGSVAGALGMHAGKQKPVTNENTRRKTKTKKLSAAAPKTDAEAAMSSLQAGDKITHDFGADFGGCQVGAYVTETENGKYALEQERHLAAAERTKVRKGSKVFLFVDGGSREEYAFTVSNMTKFFNKTRPKDAWFLGDVVEERKELAQLHAGIARIATVAYRAVQPSVTEALRAAAVYEAGDYALVPSTNVFGVWEIARVACVVTHSNPFENRYKCVTHAGSVQVETSGSPDFLGLSPSLRTIRPITELSPYQLRSNGIHT